MSNELITFRPPYLRVALLIIGALILVLAWTFIRWHLANVVAFQLDPKSPDSRIIADRLIDVSPSDPRTHLLAAKVYESSFDSEDLSRAVRECEYAASLSPHNYVMWLNLGRVRGLIGDVEGSFNAYERALALAPNYSIVRWVYGNALIREGRVEDGFSMIANAAASDPRYLGPAISTAIQIFDGNINEVRRTMGDTSTINAGLAETLMSVGREEDAHNSWLRLPQQTRSSEVKTLGQKLLAKLIEAKKYRIAAMIHADITSAEVSPLAHVVNGGFEEGVKLDSTGRFDWRITEGTYPQIGLSDSAKRSGQYSLILVFNSFETAGMRSIDQVVAVEPSRDYELVAFYRSNLKSDAILKWEVIDAATLQQLGESEPIANAAEWTPLKINFRSKENLDGILLRFIREGCGGPTCRMSGRIMFDDISLRVL